MLDDSEAMEQAGLAGESVERTCLGGQCLDIIHYYAFTLYFALR